MNGWIGKRGPVSLAAVPAMLLLLALALPVAHGGQDSIMVEDAEADVTALNPVQGVDSKSADIVLMRSYYDGDRGVFVVVVETRGEIPTESSMVLLEIGMEFYWPQGVLTTFTVAARLQFLVQSFEAYFVMADHPEYGSLVLLYPERVSYSIEGNTIIIEAETGYNTTPLALLDLPHYIRGSLTVSSETGSTFYDEFEYESPVQGEEPAGGGTGTSPAPGENTTTQEIIFRDLEGNAGDVSVSIDSSPELALYTRETGIPGVSLIVVEASVSGSSSNAHHVALAVEVFSAGELVAQFVVNSVSYGRVDSNGVVDGYVQSLEIPLESLGSIRLEFEEAMTPKSGSWDSWSYTLSFSTPSTGLAAGAIQVPGLASIADYLSRGDVEIYVTAIAFKNPEETLYATATEKAEIKVGTGREMPGEPDTTDTTGASEGSGGGGGGQAPIAPITGTNKPGTTEETTQTEETQEPGQPGGTKIPVTAVAAAIVAGIAAIAVIAKKLILRPI